MHEPDFTSFQQRLVEHGVALRYARRLAGELAEHYEDLREEAQRSGAPFAEVARLAEERLGSASNIAEAVMCRAELKSWIYRYPQVAQIALPLAFVALLPVAPLFAGVNHAGSVLRWSCCAMLSAMFTSLLFLCMQLSLTLA